MTKIDLGIKVYWMSNIFVFRQCVWNGSLKISDFLAPIWVWCNIWKNVYQGLLGTLVIFTENILTALVTLNDSSRTGTYTILDFLEFESFINDIVMIWVVNNFNFLCEISNFNFNCNFLNVNKNLNLRTALLRIFWIEICKFLIFH